MKKNKKALFGLAALAAVAAIGGTWAYWSQDLTAVNEFQTGKYDTDIKEEFTPPTPGEWVPGVEWEKKVNITNSGDVKLAAIAGINQVWVRTENITSSSLDENGNVVEETVAPAEGEYFDLMFEDEKGETQYASIIGWGTDVVALNSLSAEAANLKINTFVDNLSSADAQDKWVLVAASNTADKDGKDTNPNGKGYSDVQFIYNGIIGAKASTPELLTGATLNPAINTTIVSKSSYKGYDEDGNLIDRTLTQENVAYGYDSAKYTMTINATTVQATKSAIVSVFDAKGIASAVTDAFTTLYKDELIPEKGQTAPTEAPTVAPTVAPQS